MLGSNAQWGAPGVHMRIDLSVDSDLESEANRTELESSGVITRFLVFLKLYDPLVPYIRIDIYGVPSYSH